MLLFISVLLGRVQKWWGKRAEDISAAEMPRSCQDPKAVSKADAVTLPVNGLLSTEVRRAGVPCRFTRAPRL